MDRQKDMGGYPVGRGDAVAAWQNGEQFTATVSAVYPSGQLVLSCDDGTTAERDADAVTVVVPDDVELPEAELTATIDYREGDDRFIIRLSGRASLYPVEVGQSAADPRTRSLCTALLAVPGVEGVAVVATVDNRKRNIVIYWASDVDSATVAQAAWQVAEHTTGSIRLNRAFWQREY